jgi:AraC-like DNA-binding protein
MQIWHEMRIYDSGFPIFVDRAQDLEFLAHWHPDIEIFMVRSGSLFASVNQERRLLEEGDVMVCGSRDIHYFERSHSHSDSILLIFKPEIIGHTMLWPVGRRLARNFVSQAEDFRLARELQRLMIGVHAEMTEKKKGGSLIAKGMVLEICGLVERSLAVDIDDKTAQPPTFPALERMQRAFEYIYDHSAYPISLVDAANAASLSPSYFSRVFAMTAGSNFKTFLNMVRIEKADVLISSTDTTLADIALECGFESVRTFNRAYRALRGAAPSSARH